MAGAGLLAGLGAGLQQLGGDIFKAKVLDKLKEEESVRAEKRAEMRKAREVAKTEMITGPDGVPVLQDYNSQGQPVGTFRLPNKAQLDELKFEEGKRKQDLTKSALDIALGERSLADYDEDRALKRRLTEAQIKETEQSGIASMIRASRPTASELKEPKAMPTVTEISNALVDDFKDISAPLLEDGIMTPEEVRHNAEQAAIQARAESSDAGVIFQRRLKAFADARRPDRNK